MGRRLIAVIVVALACMPIIFRHSSGADLLADSDTAVLLHTIRQRKQPLSWFVGDWPLQNHFYRPVSTLAFEVDNALYGDHPAGYGWTQALLCIACVFALFWFVFELADSAIFAALAASLFALWTVDLGRALVLPCQVMGLAALCLGVWRHRGHVGRYLPAVLVFAYLSFEAEGLSPLYSRTEAWLPGRTATVMTFFALTSLAGYARYERIGAERSESQATSQDPPATRTSSLKKVRTAPAWGWAVLSLVCAALALGSYEQAVMLPATLIAVALSFRLRGYKPRWLVPVLGWVLLGLYLALRRSVVPSGVSGYQAQQMRHSSSIFIEMLAYAFPFGFNMQELWLMLSSGWLLLLQPEPYRLVLELASNAVAYYEAKREWVLAYTGLGMSFVAFLPMAFVKRFDHYHYWPMALRTIFVVTLASVAAKLLVSAASRPAVQAPIRPTPAPGSLPHP